MLSIDLGDIVGTLLIAITSLNSGSTLMDVNNGNISEWVQFLYRVFARS